MLNKIIYGLIGLLIRVVSKFNHNLYMKLYIPYLKKKGINIKGKPIYIGASTYFDGTDYSLFSIGDKVVISSECRFLTHDFSISRAVEACGYNYTTEFAITRPITIGNNSFIGARVILLPGTKIGDNVIVGAGSVVRGEIPDNSIIVGSPAKVVSSVDEWFNKTMEKNPEFQKYIN